MTRKLAAILVADVAGYSRLMGHDEEGTLVALKSIVSELLTPKIIEHSGRIVKSTGDGLLAEFGSVVDAVRCASEIQKAMPARNVGVADDSQFNLRIGINLGDIIIEDDDIFGDGVNVAARLEGICEPGDIVLSGSAHEQVKGKLPFIYEDMGLQTLKNIADPIQAYRIKTGASFPTNKPTGGRKPSIAVLPLTSLGSGSAHQHLGDGITEDIITELARFPQLSVIARQSSFRYRDKKIDIRQIGRELNADYVFEGSIRTLGERIRITVQLIEASSGNHVWAGRYDEMEGKIFTVQDDVVSRIASTLVGRLETAGAQRAKRKAPLSLAAYECVLRGHALPIGDPAGMAEAKQLYERAIELDPSYGRAHALLARSLTHEWDYDLFAPDSLLDDALTLAKRAVALDENDYVNHNMIGWVYLHHGAFELAQHYYQKALDMNPNDPEQVAYMGVLHTYFGEPDTALEWFSRAKRLDPHTEPNWHWHIFGVIHFTARRFDQAIAAFERSAMPLWIKVYLAACWALLGDISRSQKYKSAVLALAPEFSVRNFSQREMFKRDEDRQLLFDGATKAGLPA